MDNVQVFAWGPSLSLAADIMQHLAGKELGKCTVKSFANGETSVTLDESVRNRDVFVVSTAISTPDAHINKSVMDLGLFVDTCASSKARSVTVILPMFPYARQDKKTALKREPISAAWVARMLTASGVTRVITMDLHSAQGMGFFGNTPVDNLMAEPVLATAVSQDKDIFYDVVVSPDSGGVHRASRFMKCMNPPCALAIIHKERLKPNEVASMTLVGDVEGKNCLLVDDMGDTCNTMGKAIDTLCRAGAKKVGAVFTHGVFSHDGARKLVGADRVYTTDTCLVSDDTGARFIGQSPLVDLPQNVIICSVGRIFAEAIRRSTTSESLSALSHITTF